MTDITQYFRTAIWKTMAREVMINELFNVRYQQISFKNKKYASNYESQNEVDLLLITVPKKPILSIFPR